MPIPIKQGWTNTPATKAPVKQGWGNRPEVKPVPQKGWDVSLARTNVERAQEQAIQAQEQAIAKFEQDNVKLSTGEYVSKAEYDKLPDDKKALLQQGLKVFNDAQKAEQDKFLAVNMALPDGKYIARADAEKLQAQNPQGYNVLITEGYDAYVKSPLSRGTTNGIPNGFSEREFHDYLINVAKWNEPFYAQYGQQAYLTYFQNSTGGNLVWTPKTVNAPPTNYNPLTGEVLPGTIPGFDVNGHAIPGFPASGAGISYDTVINGVPYLKGVPVVDVPKEYLNPTYSPLISERETITTTGTGLTGAKPETANKLIVVGTSPSTGEVLVRSETGEMEWKPADPTQLAEASKILATDDKYDKPYIPTIKGIPIDVSLNTQNIISAYDTDVMLFVKTWQPYILNGYFIGNQNDYENYLDGFNKIQDKALGVQGVLEADKKIAQVILKNISALKGVKVYDPGYIDIADMEQMIENSFQPQLFVNAGNSLERVQVALDNVNARLELRKQALERLSPYKLDNGYNLAQAILDNKYEDVKAAGFSKIDAIDPKTGGKILDANGKPIDSVTQAIAIAQNLHTYQSKIEAHRRALNGTIEEINSVLVNSEPVSGRVAAVTDAIRNAGFYDPKLLGNPVIIQGFDLQSGMQPYENAETPKAEAQLQWDNLTEAQKDEVAGYYALDMYKSNYFAEYYKVSKELEAEAGILGAVVMSPVTNITIIPAKLAVGLHPTEKEYAVAGYTAATNVLSFPGVSQIVAGLGTAGTLINVGIPTAAGVYFTVDTIKNAKDMSPAQLAISVVGDALLFLPLALKAYPAISKWIKEPSEAIKQRQALKPFIARDRAIIEGMLKGETGDYSDDAKNVLSSFDQMTDDINNYAEELIQQKQAMKVVNEIGFGVNKAEADLVYLAGLKVNPERIYLLRNQMETSIRKYNELMIDILNITDIKTVRAMRDTYASVTIGIDLATDNIVTPRTVESGLQELINNARETNATRDALEDLIQRKSTGKAETIMATIPDKLHPGKTISITQEDYLKGVLDELKFRASEIRNDIATTIANDPTWLKDIQITLGNIKSIQSEMRAISSQLNDLNSSPSPDISDELQITQLTEKLDKLIKELAEETHRSTVDEKLLKQLFQITADTNEDMGGGGVGTKTPTVTGIPVISASLALELKKAGMNLPYSAGMMAVSGGAKPFELNRPASVEIVQPDVIGIPIPGEEPSKVSAPATPNVPAPYQLPPPVVTPTPTPTPTPVPLPMPIPIPTPIPTPTPTPIPVPVPVPTPVPIPIPIPTPTPTPLPVPLKLIKTFPMQASGKEIPTEAIAGIVPGTLEWRQGMYWEILPPRPDGSYNDDDIIHSKTPLPGTYRFAVGKGSAYKTIQVIGGKPLSDADVDLGFALIHISSKDGELSMHFGTDDTAWQNLSPMERLSFDKDGIKEYTEKIPTVKKERQSAPKVRIPEPRVNTVQKVTAKKPEVETSAYDRYYFNRKLRPPNLGLEL